MSEQGKKRSLVRGMGLGGATIVLACVSFAGWTWIDGLVVREVVVEGAHHADPEEILGLARIDMGLRLLDVRPAMVADRAVRHPWVLAADVRRLPGGTVAIDVEERSPVALALDPDGRPVVWLDREGYALPLVKGVAHDVPLLRGVRLPENRIRPVDTPSLLELLDTLAELDPELDALVTSFELGDNGTVTLYTAPAGGQGPIEVSLGRRGYAKKFGRLGAFWTQAVLSRPYKSFETIDLRFDGQIVTKES